MVNLRWFFMTTINLLANDQHLSVTAQPKIASGDQNSVLLHVDLTAEWDGYGTSAVFFTGEDSTVYEVILVDGNCTVPHEVLADAGLLYIGIRGVKDDMIKTSSLVKYKIVQGAPVGEGTTVPPTAGVYEQLLALAGETRDIAQAVRDDFEAGAIPALEEQNSNKGFRFWVGTKDEYEAQKDTLLPGTFCVITDDTSMAEIAADIAQLKADVDAMKGVDLGQMPFQVDVMQFDYFVVYGSTGERSGGIFDVISRDTGSLELQARWYGGFKEAIAAGQYQTYADLSFYWGDGGYMVDATARINSGAVGLLQYSKIYGFKYPVQG
jgi:hypothetical protein